MEAVPPSPRVPAPLRTWATAAVLLAGLPAAASATSPWDGPAFTASPAAIASAAAALPVPPDGVRDVLLAETRVHLDGRGAATVVRRMVYRVIGADPGSSSARVEAAWAPWSQERPRIRARVVDPEGGVHALDPAALTELPVPFRSGRRRILAGPLPGLRPGAVVEVETTVRDRAPAAEVGGLLRVPLAGTDPIRRLRIDVSAPAEVPLRWRVRAATAGAREALRGGRRQLRLERRSVAPARAPDQSAPREIATGPELAIGWGRSWAEVAEQAGAAFQASAAEADLRGVARSAAGDARTREDIVRRLVAWVHQNVRCTGVLLGEAPFPPAAPSETLRRREGDGKDVGLLLLILLRDSGLEARPALVRAAWDEIVPELPGVQPFDHAVIRVEGTPPIWIDPGDPGTPPGRLPAALQGRLALPLGPGVKGLVRTPVAPADQNRMRVERELLLSRLGRGTVVESRELSGAPADAERTLRQALSPDARDELDQRHAREVLRSEELVYASVEGTEEPEAPLRVRMEARRSEAVVTGDEAAELSVPADQLFELLPEPLTGTPGPHPGAEPAPRRAALLLPFAFRAELVYRIVPPDGFRVLGLPAPGAERFGPVQLRREFSIEPGGAVLARYLLDCAGRRMAAADADELSRRIRAIRRDRGPVVRVERISAALFRDGRIAAALAELRAVAARHPDDVVAAGQHALGLLRMGFGGAAEAEIRRGLQLQPGSGWGHRLLGLVLEHDELGRYRGPGFRRTAALAAYRQARQLEPGNAAGRAQLADLLTRDAFGRPSAEQRVAALEEYEALARELGDRSHELARLELLLQLGRFGDAEALARQLPAGGVRDAILLAAMAAGDRDAVRALAEAELLGEARFQTLREAARLLVRERRYPAAARLARAALDGAPDEPGLRAEAETLERLEPWERTRERGDEGEWTVRRLLYTLATSSDPAREISPLLAARLAEGQAELVRRSLAAPFGSMRRSTAEQGLSPTVLADMLLSGIGLERDGDRATGERVRVRLAPGRRPPAFTVFLVPAGKEERILATEAAWPVLAAEADRCAAGGELPAARRWLSFARDALGPPAEEGGPPAVLAALVPRGDEPGASEIRRAATALLAFGDAGGKTIPPLLAAQQRAGNAGERSALGFALAAAYRAAGRWSDLERAAAELARDDPGSRAALALRALALARLGGADALRTLAAEMRRRPGGDPEALVSVAGAQLAAGDLAGSLATYRSVIDSGTAGLGVYNDAAWLELFQDPPGTEALGWALRATTSETPAHAALNTLAAAHGVLGQAGPAREAFLRSLQAAGRTAPGPADWLVQGLVAEACGLPGLAREAYARVSPEPDDASAPYLLARRRVAGLDAPRTAPPPPAPAPEVAPPPPAAEPATPAPSPARKRGPHRPKPPARPARASPA